MRFVVILMLLGCSHFVFAQSEVDTVIIERDTILAENQGVTPIETYAARYNPRKAMLYAAVFPGAGQVYNRKYWKLPLVYGGFVGLGYGISANQTFYTRYKGQLLNLLNEPASPRVNQEGFTELGNKVVGSEIVSPSGLKVDQLRRAVDRFRRDRDFSVVLTFIFYMMQMVDAHVDAHLKEFDVNPQLQVSLEPALRNDPLTGKTGGVALTLKFK
jgi:hypothetical protein